MNVCVTTVCCALKASSLVTNLFSESVLTMDLKTEVLFLEGQGNASLFQTFLFDYLALCG